MYVCFYPFLNTYVYMYIHVNGIQIESSQNHIRGNIKCPKGLPRMSLGVLRGQSQARLAKELLLHLLLLKRFREFVCQVLGLGFRV